LCIAISFTPTDLSAKDVGLTKISEMKSSEKESLEEVQQEPAGISETDDKIKAELNRVLATANELKFLQEEAINSTAYPLRDQKFMEARRQPKPKMEEENLASKYGQIRDTSERAYQILVDLGMVEASAPIDMTKFEGIIDMDYQ
jgi:hypothetical protein